MLLRFLAGCLWFIHLIYEKHNKNASVDKKYLQIIKKTNFFIE